MKQHAAYIGLGSNLDDPVQHIQSALKQIDNHQQIDIIKRSSLYRSKPIGPQDQPDFINAVVAVTTELEPLALLEAMQTIEHQHGRIREIHWGARTLDLDLLLYNDEVIDHERLIIPHPHLTKRAFVLIPLAEINPELHIPGFTNVAKLLDDVDQTDVNKIDKHDKRVS